MITTLGPRHVNWRDAQGRTGVVTIVVQGLPDQTTDLGEGVVARSVKAQVHISSSWQDRVMFALGQDELEVMFRLLQFTSLYLEQMCEDRGVELTDYVTPLSVITDFAVFRSVALD